MSPDPFFRVDAQPASQSQPPEHCPESCPLSAPSGFCSARIHPECLTIDKDGVARVALSMSPKEWFDRLNDLGEMFQLSRNTVAVLGRLGGTPKMIDWRNPVLPRDSQDLFTPNLAEYGSLWAVREVSALGTVHSLEARDVSGTSFQRIVMSRDERRDVFERFVTDHQSPSSQATVWFPPNHKWSAHRCRAIASRIPWLRHQITRGVKDVRVLPSESAARVLAAAAHAGLPIRTTLYSRAMINGAVWVPAVQTTTDHQTGETMPFFSGNKVGLHLNSSAIVTAWFWTGACSCCDERRWSVEVGDVNDHVSLAIMAGSGSLEPRWRELLTKCLG